LYFSSIKTATAVDDVCEILKLPSILKPSTKIYGFPFSSLSISISLRLKFILEVDLNAFIKASFAANFPAYLSSLFLNLSQ
jgi:hypothetical protein